MLFVFDGAPILLREPSVPVAKQHDHPEGVTLAGRPRWGSTEHWFQSVVPSRNWLWVPVASSRERCSSIWPLHLRPDRKSVLQCLLILFYRLILGLISLRFRSKRTRTKVPDDRLARVQTRRLRGCAGEGRPVAPRHQLGSLSLLRDSGEGGGERKEKGL